MATTSVLAPVPATPPPDLLVQRRSILSRVFDSLAVPVIATLLALLVGAVVMDVALGNLTIGIYAYRELFVGAFGSWYDFQESLVDAVPLMFAAFAVAFSFRGGLFNIGAEGQLYAGAIVSTYLGITFNWSPWLLLPACVVGGALGGALWALIPGVLKAYRGAHEVVTTMMLNYVALYLMDYLVNINPSTGAKGPMQFQPGIPTTAEVHVPFPKIVPSWLVQNPDLSLALILALVAGVGFWFLLARTTLGYNIRATGFNVKAARYAGINVNRTIMYTLLISGAFAGLAGMAAIFGLFPYQMQDRFDNYTIGFDAIAVALLGRNTATGAVLAAIFFGALAHGSILMQQYAGIDPHIIQMIQGLIILFVGADAFVRYLARRAGQPGNYFYRRYLGPLVPWNKPQGEPMSEADPAAPGSVVEA